MNIGFIKFFNMLLISFLLISCGGNGESDNAVTKSSDDSIDVARVEELMNSDFNFNEKDMEDIVQISSKYYKMESEALINAFAKYVGKEHDNGCINDDDYEAFMDKEMEGFYEKYKDIEELARKVQEYDLTDEQRERLDCSFYNNDQVKRKFYNFGPVPGDL